MPEEKVYIGTKVVKAFALDKASFIQRKSNGEQKILDADNEAGYLVRYEDGYESWSPKATFERAYRQVTEAEKAMMI